MEGQAEARSGGSGSRPIQMDYGSKCDEGSSSDGNDGSQGGSSVNSFQEERNGMKKRSNFGNTGTKSGTMEKNLAHMELQNCGQPCEAEENAIGPGMLCEGGGLSSSPEEGEASVGKL